MSSVPVTATVTAHRRIDRTIATIQTIQACRPGPDEILVHVDAGGEACLAALRDRFPELSILASAEPVGPGGGRNKLMRAARNELLANFDDDSCPIDSDYFERVVSLFTEFPGASVLTGQVFHRHETITPAHRHVQPSGSFCGGAVAFRRQHLVEAGGYLPLVVAYGAEEEDMALRLLDSGREILYTPWLRVFHDSDLSHHGDPRINALALANLGLVAFLRYPLRYWPYGLLQIGSRLLWCLRQGRRRGLLHGLIRLPSHAWRHRGLRKPISVSAMRKKLALRRTHDSRKGERPTT